MGPRLVGWFRGAVVLASVVLVLTACSAVVTGRPSFGNAANANLLVQGDSGGPFDAAVKNSLSDVFDFWKQEFPTLTGGHPLTPLKGGLYSVDGLKVAQTHTAEGAARHEGCIVQGGPGFIVDNGVYCRLDDSIVWDRAPTHLFPKLAQKYGTLMVALIFAHEMGHAISNRLGVFDKNLPIVNTESQADCAAGAWAAWALKGHAAHFREITPAKVDAALEGFLDGRDSIPGTAADVSHGNGFDRLSAVADGLSKGPSYCFSPGYFASRVFTERPFASRQDYAAGGNTALDQVLTPGAGNFVVNDLNRFWTGAAKLIGKTFTPVKIAEAPHPRCAPNSPIEFGYCPDDNTVYYSRSFATHVYYSLPTVSADSVTGNITLLSNQPADFSLGVLFSVGWGLAVRHQLFNLSLTDRAALIAVTCYTGAYAKDTNVEQPTHGQLVTLSPADLDKATSAMLDQIGRDQAFSNQGTTGLERIQAFVKGYRGGLASC